MAARAQPPDDPASLALALDACPDGSIGSPPACLAVTGDTSPLKTRVVTPAMLSARGDGSNSTVHPASDINPRTAPVQLQDLVIGGIERLTPTSRPTSRPAAIQTLAQLPQLPKAGSGRLLAGESDHPIDWRIPLAGLILTLTVAVEVRRLVDVRPKLDVLSGRQYGRHIRDEAERNS
jgi:hypothetical protein